FPSVTLFDPSSGSATSALPFDTANLEAFARGATYDVLLTYESVLPSTFDPTNPSIAQNDLRLHFLEGKSVTDDTTIAVNSSDATHTITFDGRNENGEAIASRDFQGYGSIGRIVFPAGSPIASLPLSAYLSRTWHVTDLNQKLITGELNYDIANSRFYVLQYPTLDGVHGDLTLAGGGADLKRVDATFALTPPATTDQRIVILTQSVVPAGDNVNTLGLVLLEQAPRFNETIFMNSTPADPTYSMAAYTESITDGVVRFITPLMRVLGGQLVPTVGGGPVTPFSFNTDEFLFGNGMHFPRFNFAQSSGKVSLFTDFVGQLGEVRSGDRPSTVTTVVNNDASVQASGTTYPMPLDLTTGPLTITSVDANLLAPGIPRTSTVTSRIDASHYPPTFTAMMLFDASGKLAASLAPHQPGSLSFAAADFSYSTTNVRTYHAIAGDKTRVSFRYSGAADWQPLTATQTGEDQNFGIAYRVDLTNVANADNVLVDLKFEIADAAGNTTSFVMAPAFAVGRDSWFGRRGPRR
ncbi:MAG TPA: hypothetical protein VKU62_02715, partial [Thermoanaerobaculia bacterium]|nr:hypothetical protein [Thermoanaerobaculia bacterium]